MTPKYTSSDSGNLYVSKRSSKLLLWSEKVNVFNLIRKKKKHLYAEVVKIYSKNKCSTIEIKNDKEIHAGFAVAPQTAKVMHSVW